MDIPENQIIDTPLGELTLNPENPRTITPEALASLVRSIEAEPGMLRARPVVARLDGTIIAGNMRYRAAQELDLETVPAIRVDIDDDRARLWMLRDNNEYGEWESQELAQMLASLDTAGADLELSGFATGELTDLLKLLEPPEQPIDRGDALATLDVSLGAPEHVVEKGEVWMVGEHHLVVASVYDGWPIYAALLNEGDLFVPYPTPILPLTKRARENRLVMVQSDVFLAGHLLDKYADVNGGERVYKVES